MRGLFCAVATIAILASSLPSNCVTASVAATAKPGAQLWSTPSTQDDTRTIVVRNAEGRTLFAAGDSATVVPWKHITGAELAKLSDTAVRPSDAPGPAATAVAVAAPKAGRKLLQAQSGACQSNYYDCGVGCALSCQGSQGFCTRLKWRCTGDTKTWYCPCGSRLVCTTTGSVIAVSCSKSTTSSPPPSTSKAPAEFANLLAQHNERRARHGTPALTWDSSLAANAQAWINKLPCGTLNHGTSSQAGSASNLGQGENLHVSGSSVSSGPGRQSTIDQSIVGWYDKEVSLYNYNSPGFSLATGHFTQVVWRSTTKVGCAITSTPCFSNGSYWLTVSCRYSPSGNIGGQFSANVPRRLSG